MQVPTELRAKLDADQDVGLIVRTTAATIEPAKFDFIIRQGATLALRIAWQDASKQVLDLSSGYTAKLTVRDTWGGTAITGLTLTQAEGITLLDGNSGCNIVVARTATQTGALTGWLRAVYDLEVAALVTTRLLEGFVTLRREVTT
jgi:hypothetical protein